MDTETTRNKPDDICLAYGRECDPNSNDCCECVWRDNCYARTWLRGRGYPEQEWEYLIPTFNAVKDEAKGRYPDDIGKQNQFIIRRLSKAKEARAQGT